MSPPTDDAEGRRLHFTDVLHRVRGVEGTVGGLVPKVERIEVRQEAQGEEQTRQGVEQTRQGGVVDELHDEQVGDRAVKGWRRRALVTTVSLAGLILTILSIYAIVSARS